MSLAARGVATAVGLGAIMVIYRLLGVDQMARVFKKKELKDKYDYIIGNVSLCCTFDRQTSYSGSHQVQETFLRTQNSPIAYHVQNLFICYPNFWQLL